MSKMETGLFHGSQKMFILLKEFLIISSIISITRNPSGGSGIKTVYPGFISQIRIQDLI